MIQRVLTKEILQTAKEFKVLCVTGPRQSGKTTLCKLLFKDKPYVTLEDPDVAEEATKEGRAFLNKFPKGAVIDEAQRVPSLFNYLQGIVDAKGKNNQFVLTGSNNFLLQQSISQSLAGRTAYIELLPFSCSELRSRIVKNDVVGSLLLNGFYPAIVTKKSSPERWLSNYIKTYVDRDVRLLRNISNANLFTKFLKLCAGRAAQILNINSLSIEVGVDHKTIQAWLAILESSYIIFLLQPYHQNFNKRMIKSPKLYFHDVGLLSHLLGLKSTSAIEKSSFYGHIFENFIVSEIRKNRYNKEQSGEMYFLRDSSGNEVDVILEKDGELIPVEIKSAKKINASDIKNLAWFQKVYRQHGGIILYRGDVEKTYENAVEQMNWKAVCDL